MSNDETTSEIGTGEAGKGRPTPKRKEAESARKQGISVPKDPKAARRAARERDREARAKSRAGLMAGDPAFFPRRDAGPVKAQVRDYIDRRRTVGEFFVPFAFVVLLLGLVNNPTVQTTVVYVWTSVLLLVVLDTILVGILLGRSLRKDYPNKTDRKGAVSYGVLRALQLRRFRIPPPRIKAGGKPVTPKVKK
ncbi:MAG: DUF3043 domain-containing protein [Actinobacteria bacterium]|jgi:hypothetical protein|nr:DUF3043 domain-containing protein [Actinomycetota bacterium]NBO35322.1 DUF3043 domain-containing protein [Actinomycetota bacterium]